MQSWKMFCVSYRDWGERVRYHINGAKALTVNQLVTLGSVDLHFVVRVGFPRPERVQFRRVQTGHIFKRLQETGWTANCV